MTFFLAGVMRRDQESRMAIVETLFGRDALAGLARARRARRP
jgi:hypothetical protein